MLQERKTSLDLRMEEEEFVFLGFIGQQPRQLYEQRKRSLLEILERNSIHPRIHYDQEIQYPTIADVDSVYVPKVFLEQARNMTRAFFKP